MNYDTIRIKQIPDDTSVLTGLDKYNRSKMPGTTDFLQAGEIAGRKVTGIDENAYEIEIMTDEEEKDKIYKETKALRENLEKLTNKDLSGTSAFWDTFGVRIDSDSELTLNMAVPLDKVRYFMLVANGYVAPNRAAASLPKYRGAKYYCHVDETVVSEEVSTQKIRDKARGELLKLSEDKDKLVLIGQYLEGDRYKLGMKPDTLYKMLSDYINKPTEPDNLKRFLKAVNVGVEELQYKVLVDRAIKKKIIRLRDGYYQRGQVTLGKSPFDVYENLKKPDFATEYLSIKQELEGE